MREDVKAQWVAALRSGEFEQGRGSLHEQRVDGSSAFCCLGVLCELAVEAGVVERGEVPTFPSSVIDYDGDTGILPLKVMRWAGMPGSTGRFRYAVSSDGVVLSAALSEVNDVWGLDFEQIADVVEYFF